MPSHFKDALAATSVLGLVAAATFAVVASGCSANSSTASQEARAKSMLDQHDYASAVTILEQEHQKDPANKSTALLLAQAHLGAAGVELFDFISQVFGQQPASDELDLFEEPHCGTEAISKFQGYDLRCIALRVLRRLPDADNPDLERARSLLREDFPDDAKCPTDVNFLGAFIELGSAFGRLRVLLKRALVVEVQDKARITPGELPFGLVIHHLKRFFTELTNGFVRARYSYGKVNKYVVGYEGKPLIKVSGSTLVFSDSIGIGQIAHFAADVLKNSADQVDDSLNNVVSKNVQNIGQGLLKVLQTVDTVEFNDEAKTQLFIAFRFEGMLGRLLQKLARDPESPPKVDLFGLFWDSPPEILKTLRQASLDSWNTEESGPMKSYFTGTKDQWDALNDIMLSWENWMSSKLTQAQQDSLIKHFRDLGGKHPELFSLPEHVNPDSMRTWQAQVLATINTEVTKALNGEIDGIPPLTDEARVSGNTLLFRSLGWIETNLWPLPAHLDGPAPTTPDPAATTPAGAS